jgi:hypothetical protein
LKGLLFLHTMLSLQGGHYAPEIGRSSLWSLESPGLLIWFSPFKQLS